MYKNVFKITFAYRWIIKRVLKIVINNKKNKWFFVLLFKRCQEMVLDTRMSSKKVWFFIFKLNKQKTEWISKCIEYYIIINIILFYVFHFLNYFTYNILVIIFLESNLLFSFYNSLKLKILKILLTKIICFLFF